MVHKSVIYFIPTSGGGCGYKWNPVLSALCRFCQIWWVVSAWFFSKYPWVRYGRSKKNVTPTPTLPCLIGLSSSVEPDCIFTAPTSTPLIPTNNTPPLYCLYPYPKPTTPRPCTASIPIPIEIGPKRLRAELTRLLRPKRPTPKIGWNDPGPNPPELVQMTGTFKVTAGPTLQALVLLSSLRY